ncbi:MAG: hypothetical protein IKW45_06595 [Clostridia bacterium]|nr:hypothetical protein [Clostridia bacterium]
MEDLTEVQKRAYILADNKLAIDAGWDEEILKIELQELKNLDFNFDFIFNEFEYSTIMDDFHFEKVYDDELIEKYSEKAETYLAVKRVILTYKTEEEEQFIRNIINNPHGKMKVVYSVEEILRNEENNSN